MQFTIQCEELSKALNNIKKALGVVEHVSVVVSEKHVELGATNKISTCTFHLVNVQVEATGKFTLPIEQFMGTIKSRKVMEFKLTDNSLKFRSTEGRSYNGDITTIPYEEIAIQLEEANLKIKLDGSKVKKFYELTNRVVLSGAYEDKTPLPIYLQIKEGGVKAICYDNFHLACVEDRTLHLGMEATVALLPASLATIEAVSGGSGFNLTLSSSSIYAYNKHFRLVQPLIQPDSGTEEDKVNNIEEFISDLMEKEATKAEVSKEDFDTIFGNAITFYSQGIPIEMVVSDGSVSLRVTSSYGKVLEKISATNVVEPSKTIFKCEMSILGELLLKLGSIKTLPLSYVEDTCMYIHWEDDNNLHFYSSGLLV